MYEGFRNVEKARKLVQNDLAVRKEEIRKPKMGSGSTVCSEASTGVGLGASGTFARPQGVAFPCHEVFIHDENGIVKAGSLITQEAVFTELLTERLWYSFVTWRRWYRVNFTQYIDWDQTRKEQGNWQTKTIVNMCFKNETNLATMIVLLKVVKEELKKVSYKIRDQEGSLQH